MGNSPDRPPESAATEPTETTEPRSPVVQYVIERKYALLILVLFMLGGALIAPNLFPELHPARAALGGVVFGGFCTLCVAVNRFL